MYKVRLKPLLVRFIFYKKIFFMIITYALFITERPTERNNFIIMKVTDRASRCSVFYTYFYKFHIFMAVLCFKLKNIPVTKSVGDFTC